MQVNIYISLKKSSPNELQEAPCWSGWSFYRLISGILTISVKIRSNITALYYSHTVFLRSFALLIYLRQFLVLCMQWLPNLTRVLQSQLIAPKIQTTSIHNLSQKKQLTAITTVIPRYCFPFKSEKKNFQIFCFGLSFHESIDQHPTRSTTEILTDPHSYEGKSFRWFLLLPCRSKWCRSKFSSLLGILHVKKSTVCFLLGT